MDKLGDHKVTKMYVDMDKYRSQTVWVAWLKTVLNTESSDTAADSNKLLCIPLCYLNNIS